MFYVGLDIHSKRISLCVLNATGRAFWQPNGGLADAIELSGAIPL
jgi:hypothetical protein